MRKLCPETSGVELQDKASLVELKDEIKQIQAQVSEQDSDIETLKAKVDGKDDLVATKVVRADRAEITRLDAHDISTTSINSNEGNVSYLKSEGVEVSGRVLAGSVASSTGSIDTLTSKTFSSDVANLDEANIGTLSAEEWSVEDMTVDNLKANVKVEAVKVDAYDGNIVNLSSTNVSADTVSTTDLEAEGARIINLESTKVKTDEGEVRSLLNMSRFHDAYFIHLENPISDTNFNIIELPRITSGSYWVTLTNEGGDVLFSFKLENSEGNISFSYSRGEEQKFLSEVEIYENRVYLKTWYGGKLYYTNESLHDVPAPESYSEYPYDEENLTYKYNAIRRYATVYTQYFSAINLLEGGGQEGIGDGVLVREETSDYSLLAEQAKTLEYDGNSDVAYYAYIPDQSVNTDDDVTHKTISITEEAYLNALTVGGGSARQILRVPSAGDTLVYEDTAKAMMESQPVTVDDKLVEQSLLSVWDGSSISEDEEGKPVYKYGIKKLGEVTEGTWNAGDVTTPKITTEELVTDGITNNGDLEVTGDAHITGNLTVDGTVTTVHTEEVTTQSNTVVLRKDATTAIQPGEVSGIEIENYDGEGTTLQLAVDSEGTLRIGTDVGTSGGDNEPILTRSESEDLEDANILIWNATNNKAVDSGYTVGEVIEEATPIKFVKDIGELELTTATNTKSIYDEMSNDSIAVLPDTDVADKPAPGIVVIIKTHRPKAVCIPKTNAGSFYLMDATTDNSTLTGTWYNLFTAAYNFVANGNGDIDAATPYDITKQGTMAVGNLTGTHLEFDGNEIIAKSNATSLGSLYFHGTVYPDDLVIPQKAPTTIRAGSIWIANV